MKKIALLALAATFMFACQTKKTEATEEVAVEDMELLEETPTEEVVVVDETPQETVYQVRGMIVEIPEADAEGNTMVMVSHEEIPEVMGAMKMALKSNAAYLSEIAKDDKVSFEMVKTDEGYTMRNVAKLPAETELTLMK
ncbi:copper-binding protein [Bernardetia sp. OM2101]|uniref:copper-binding protein n=1 Tax=Bernardetia sp. OM2101 TaxID=3344876 RepID=UPI0035CFE6F5